MTDTPDATAAAAPTAVADSQVIAPQEGHEHGRTGHIPEAEAPKPEEPKRLSTREAIEKAIDDTQAKADAKSKEPDPGKAKAEPAKTEPKADAAKADDKPAERQRAEDGKFAKAEPAQEPKAEADKGAPEQAAAERSAPEDRRQSEGRKYAEPPARFLPEARTKWANVPNEVKAEFHRISQEMEVEIERGRAASKSYEPIRPFEDLAQRHGKQLKDVLGAYVGMEHMLRTDPVRGVAEILRNIGLTPEAYAKHVTENPEMHRQALVRPQQPQPQQDQQQPQTAREVAELRAELHSMKVQQTVLPIVQEFGRSHPDFEELSPTVTAIIESGVIDQIYGAGLSLEQKLTEAYRMAGGTTSPSRSEPEAQPAPAAPPQARPVDPDGQLSIRGAPGSGQTQTQRRFKTNREALEALFPQ